MKNRKALYKLCSTFATVSMAVTSLALPVMAEETPETTPATATVDIYPKPQEVTYDSAEGMHLEGTVDLVIHGEVDELSVNKIKSVLDDQNIEYVETDEADPDHAVITVSASDDHCDTCAEIESPALEEGQGYILYTDNDENTKGEVRIVGADQDGVYNGILSLSQLLDQRNSEGNFAEVLIADYPDIKLRGFVEGFYGYPWSFENRISVIEQASQYKINTYIYAPKDDPYHKDNWRELYPEEEAQKIAQLVQTCKDNNVEFVWCAHPGNGYNYSTDTDYNTLITKLEQLYSLGVRRFGLSYDDLSGSANGANQAALINRVEDYFYEKYGDVGSMFTVGQRYTDGWGADWNTYLKPYLTGLKDDVIVMWTGLNTGGNCTADSFNGPRDKVGYQQELAFWFNYPVNDMAFGRLMMGALNNCDPNLTGLRGFFMNPMNQAQASKVAIYQGADYSWNIADYDYNTSWDRAIKEVLPAHADALKRFSDNVSYHSYEDLSFDESYELRPYLDALDAAIGAKSGVVEAATALKNKFIEMENDADELLAMEDEALLADIEQHLHSYKDMGTAGVAAMNGILAAAQGDSVAMQAYQAEMTSALSSSNSYTIHALNRNNGDYLEPVQVGTRYIKPYITSCTTRMNSVLKNALSPEVEARVLSADDGVTGTVTLTGGNYVGTLSGTVVHGGYAGFAMPTALKIRDITSDNLPDGCYLEYSLNGIDWQAWTEESGYVDAGYVRIVNASGSSITLDNQVLTAYVLYNVTSLSASTNMSTYGSYRISNATDGNFNTKYYSADGASAGDYISVDMGTNAPLHDVTFYFGGNPKGAANGIDGFQQARLELSLDGISWTSVGSVAVADCEEVTINNNLMAKFTYDAGGQVARYFRVVNEVSYENWVQLYEIEINQDESIVGDDEVVLTETNTNGIGRNVHDADVSTAFTLPSASEGDYLIYKLSNITSAQEIQILQDTVSNAKVSVLPAGSALAVSDDEGWVELGTLDSLSKTFTTNAILKAVRLDFVAGSQVSIAEIVVRPTSPLLDGTISNPSVEEGEAEKALLGMAIAYAQAAKDNGALEGVNELVAELFNTRLDAAIAVYNNENATQSAVDKAWRELSEAIHMLSFYSDKTELAALVAAAQAIDLSQYKAEGKEEFEAALEFALEVLNNPAVLTDGSIQEAIDRLQTAMNNLEKKGDLDTSLLEFLVSICDQTDLDAYIEAGKPEFVEALAQAKAVLADPQDQPQIDAAVSTLNSAYLNLRLKADESLLQTLKDFVDTASNIDRSLYTAEQLSVIDSALANISTALANHDLKAPELDQTTAKSLEKESMAALEVINSVQPSLTAGTTDKTNQAVSTSGTKTASASALGAFGALFAAAGASLVAMMNKRRR